MHQSSLNSHKNKGHSPFFFPPIMRSSVGQCRNIRFRQLSASHVIITSDIVLVLTCFFQILLVLTYFFHIMLALTWFFHIMLVLTCFFQILLVLTSFFHMMLARTCFLLITLDQSCPLIFRYKIFFKQYVALFCILYYNKKSRNSTKTRFSSSCMN